MTINKKWYKSKQIWTGIGALIVTILGEVSPEVKQFISDSPDLLGYLTAGALIIYRFINRGEKIVVTKPETKTEIV